MKDFNKIVQEVVTRNRKTGLFHQSRKSYQWKVKFWTETNKQNVPHAQGTGGIKEVSGKVSGEWPGRAGQRNKRQNALAKLPTHSLFWQGKNGRKWQKWQNLQNFDRIDLAQKRKVGNGQSRWKKKSENPTEKWRTWKEEREMAGEEKVASTHACLMDLPLVTFAFRFFSLCFRFVTRLVFVESNWFFPISPRCWRVAGIGRRLAFPRTHDPVQLSIFPSASLQPVFVFQIYRLFHRIFGLIDLCLKE